MKAYRVFENSARCASHMMAGWDVDTFATKRAAELFMLCWAYPYTLDAAREDGRTFDIGVQYDLGMTEFPVLMEIREVEEYEEQVCKSFGDI